MTPETFLEEFGAVANAPGGVQRLREMILQLAVMGKLVEQDPGDEPAGELLNKVKDEINSLIGKGIIKKQKPLAKLKRLDIRYEAPKNWSWVKLGDIGFWKSGSTPSRTNSQYYNGDIPWVKSGEVKQGRIKDTEERITYNALEKCPLSLNPVGSVLVAMYGANIGEIGVLEIEAATNQAICACTTYSIIESGYLVTLLKSLKPEFIKSGAGAAQPNISRKKIVNTACPLPPLAEQKRIVAKVDQLMALCDRLEAQQQKRATLMKQARISTLGALADAPGGKALSAAWKRVRDHLPMLFDHPDDVEDLKKCILQNAVMGKLVPQNPEDEPASELLKKIVQEKAALIKKGEIKKQKPLPEIREDEKPFEIPEGWTWCRIGQILSIKHGYAFKSNYFKKDTGQYVLTTPGNFFEKGGFRDQKSKTKFYEGPIPAGFILNPNDLIVAMTEQAAGLLGSAAFIPNDGKIYLHNQRLGKLITSESFISKEYIFWYFNSPYLREKVSESATGMKVKHTSPDKILTILIPLAPLAEQTRIVQKTQSLLSLCDTLQNQLKKSRTIAEQFAKSIVETITGQTTEKHEKMKAPKTELVSKLKLVKKPGKKTHAPLSAILAKHRDELSAKALWNTSGLAIEDFYRQLKTEMAGGWIAEPEKAHVRIVDEPGSAP